MTAFQNAMRRGLGESSKCENASKEKMLMLFMPLMLKYVIYDLQDCRAGKRKHLLIRIFLELLLKYNPAIFLTVIILEIDSLFS